MLLKTFVPIAIAVFSLSVKDALSQVECGQSENNPHGRIVGGTGAMETSWPWIGSLRRSSGSHTCGATLISERWAITAAHCVGAIFSVVFGDLSRTTESAYHQEKLFRVFSHPEYDSDSLENDIAMLRFDSDVTFDDHVSPACLAEASTYSNCWITGWGHTTQGGSLSDVLQEAPVNLFTSSQCAGFYGRAFSGDVMICAGEEQGGIDTCQGDSGGPMVCENSEGAWELVGITSWGYGCAQPNYPGVYTRVSQFKDFISDMLNAAFVDCQTGPGFFMSDVDECDHVASCADGTDEESCPGLTLSDIVPIQSVSYPADYPINQNTLWLFKAADPSAKVMLHFMTFDLETNYDFVRAGDGWDATDSGSVLLEHTGGSVPGDVVSTGSRMWVRFTSDFSISKQGFSAMVTVDEGDGATMSCSDGVPCTGDHEECQMVEQGGTLVAACVCMTGYDRVDGVCADINECVHLELNTCNSEIKMCMNEEGTFTCECKPEYIDGDSCNPDAGGDDVTPPPDACGLRPVIGRVVGGQNSVEGASPWIASLRFGSHSCGATLIDPGWAITAAHCIGYFNIAVLGDLRLDSVSSYHQQKTVESIFQHPGYNDRYLDNDLALLKLASPVMINNYVRPACLAMSQWEVTTYSNCFIAGWGATREGGSGSNILQEAAVNLFTDDECRSFYGSDYNSETMICAGFESGGIDTCQGDSGGPLVCQDANDLWHLVGVTSWGDGCARPGKPGVYTRVSKYTTFIEDIRNYDFMQCPDGTVLLPSNFCDYVWNCQDGSDEAECDAIPTGTMISLGSPNYPGNYPNSADVVYLVPGESGSRLHVHFEAFDLENGYDYLEVGYGSSPDDGFTVATLTGAGTIENLVIDGNVGWLRFTSDGDVTKAGFLAKISVINADASFVCSDGHVIWADSVCDQLVDCTENSEDETNCEPLPNGSSFLLESPNYPDEYPNSHTSTFLFVAESPLSVKLTFDHFDLEAGFDYLTVGHGQDPTSRDTVLALLTGSDIPGEMVSPSSAMWITFGTDFSIPKTGFSVNVDVVERTEICSTFLTATENVQVAERYEVSGEDCGISIVAMEPNSRIELVITEGQIDCDSGEYIEVQQSTTGLTQDRQRQCRILSDKTFLAGDSVTLIDYRLQLEGHGFRFTYRSVDDPEPNFEGCSELLSVKDSQVEFTSPRYPRNYRPKNRCEYRLVAHPGKRLQVTFTDFQLESDPDCRKDYVRLRDLVTGDQEKYCGSNLGLQYTSQSNYVSVFFRSNNRYNYKGFKAEAIEVS